MKTAQFDTPITLSGPFRAPKQMLATQEYGGHVSIHDDNMAKDLGFKGAPIEGPTHFSQFVPLLQQIWGQEWEERGCLSSHFKNVAVEGEEVRAFVEVPLGQTNYARIWAEKKDGTLVLEGSATIGPDTETALDVRRKKLRPPEKLIIMRDVKVGMKNEPHKVQMGFDQNMGKLYPFTLLDKLKVITEKSDWCTPEGGKSSPWGKAIVPLEMMGPLTEYSGGKFPVRGPAVGLFADLEIKMVKGPIFVGKEYDLDREIVGLSESRKTESCWVLTSLRDPDSGELVAQALLNSASLKDSFASYAEELAAK